MLLFVQTERRYTEQLLHSISHVTLTKLFDSLELVMFPDKYQKSLVINSRGGNERGISM